MMIVMIGRITGEALKKVQTETAALVVQWLLSFSNLTAVLVM